MTPSSFHHPDTEVRRTEGKGAGLFTTAPISAGTVVVVTGGRIQPFSMLKTYELPGHPFQVEFDQVIAPFDPQRLDGIFTVNHSCAPTCGIRGQVSLVALRDLGAGEEITYDYVMTDSDPAGVETFAMDCLCGTSACRGRVTDVDWRQPALQRRYRGWFSPYLQARIETANT